MRRSSMHSPRWNLQVAYALCFPASERHVASQTVLGSASPGSGLFDGHGGQRDEVWKKSLTIRSLRFPTPNEGLMCDSLHEDRNLPHQGFG